MEGMKINSKVVGEWERLEKEKKRRKKKRKEKKSEWVLGEIFGPEREKGGEYQKGKMQEK